MSWWQIWLFGGCFVLSCPVFIISVCVDICMSADAAVYILTLSGMHISAVLSALLGVISYMLYVQQQYFLHAYSSIIGH